MGAGVATKIDVRVLTTYAIGDDGTSIALGFRDCNGEHIRLNMTIDQLGMLLMTLPTLIEKALRCQYHEPTLRYMHPVEKYAVEQASDPNALIITLGTTGGFDASFTASREQASAL